jgi:hypothetical protein
MTDSTAKAQLAQVTIAGREITVRRPTDIQFIMIRRAMKVAEATVAQLASLQDEKDADGDRMAELNMKGLDATSDMLDMIERLVVGPDDRAFLVEQMKDGAIDLPDFEMITEAFAEKGPVKKVAKAKLVR